MKPAFAVAFAALFSACAPLTIYHREGVTVARMQSDETKCEVSALTRVPPSIERRRDPPRYIPGPRICNELGQCHYGPGYYIPGSVYTVDVNKSLRARVVEQCMAQKGYARVSVPVCPGGVANAAPPAQTQVLPRLTPKSCVIRNRDVGWQIVNQAQ